MQFAEQIEGGGLVVSEVPTPPVSWCHGDFATAMAGRAWALSEVTFRQCRFSDHYSVHTCSSSRAIRYHRVVQLQELLRHRNQKSLQAAGSLLCAAIAWRFVLDLEGTEFSGGRITGPVLQLQTVGTLLFLLAATFTFPFRRTASVIALLACLPCLPLYLLLTAAGPFRWVVGGEWKVPLFGNPSQVSSYEQGPLNCRRRSGTGTAAGSDGGQ
jgi:hypothetical protein